MGKALEWLGAEGCRSLAEQILTEPKPGKRGEIGAHCPFHSEQTPGGAFSYNCNKDISKCMSCGVKGDLISIYSAVYGLDEKDGFLEFKKKYGNDNNPYPRPEDRPKVKQPANYYEQCRSDMQPVNDKWKERAWSFVKHSFERLIDNEKAMTELYNRWRIKEETVVNFGFGINDVDKYPSLSAWNLPGNGKLWLPKGLVMPCIIEGEVRKIKIRRPDPSTPWGELRPYWEVKGGENFRFHYYINPNIQPRVLVVTEAERDAAVVFQECANMCDGALGSIAGGGATKRPCDSETINLIKSAEYLLVALDTDAAGEKNALNFWENAFGFATYWPVPGKYGKDIGEAIKNGLNVKAWIQAALPAYMKKELE